MLVIGIAVLFFSDFALGKTLMTASLPAFILAQTIREIVGYLQRRNSGENDERDALIDGERREFETKGTSKLIEEKPFVPVSSATENSTELLFADKKSSGSK